MFLIYAESPCVVTVFFPRFLEELIGKNSWFHCGEAFNFFHANKNFLILYVFLDLFIYFIYFSYFILAHQNIIISVCNQHDET